MRGCLQPGQLLPRGDHPSPALRRVRCLQIPERPLFAFPAALLPFHPSLRDAAAKSGSLPAPGASRGHILGHFCAVCCPFAPSPPERRTGASPKPGKPQPRRGRDEIFTGKSERERERLTPCAAIGARARVRPIIHTQGAASIGRAKPSSTLLPGPGEPGEQERPCSLSPHPQATGVCAPFLRDAVWSPNPGVGLRLCGPKRRDLVPHHCPAFFWALGPACSHHRAPKNIPACLCRLGLQEVHLLGTPAPLMHSTCQGGFLNKVCFLFFCATVIILFHQLQKINVSFQLEALA